MKKLFLLFTVALLWSACSYEKGEVPVAEIPCDSMSYATNIVPILNEACNSCHVPGGGGTGDFSSYPELKLAADNGSLKRQVMSKAMPPAGSPEITDRQRSMIKCWVEQGAPQN